MEDMIKVLYFNFLIDAPIHEERVGKILYAYDRIIPNDSSCTMAAEFFNKYKTSEDDDIKPTGSKYK